MIVVIEGADGCGKTTIGEALARMLPKAELIHFPDDEAVTGPMIRSYLKKHWQVMGVTDDQVGAPASALAFQALQITNRMERMSTIAPCDSSLDDHVVLVRYWQSAWVYGQLDGLDPKWLEEVHTSMPHGDMNILLDVDAETSESRRAARDGDASPERYEGRRDFTQKVIGLYRELWNGHVGVNYIVDAREPLHKVIAVCGELIIGRLLRLSRG